MAKADSAAPLRRSTRVNVSIPVKISGTLPDKRPFSEDTYILTISKHGARLKTRQPLKVGMQLRVQPTRSRNAALFQVVWTGREGTPRAGEVGIEYLEVSSFLGVFFPD